MRNLLRRNAAALAVRNFRLYALGQLISLSGTWMQTVALSVLALELTGKGATVGVVFSLQFVPVLILGPHGGAIADRVRPRVALGVTQISAGLIAVTLGVLTATGGARLWMVYVLAAGVGVVNAVDGPLRHTFVYALVGPDDLPNAVGLNVLLTSLTRIAGPALGGVIIATAGLSACFFGNAASFLAAIVALILIRPEELHSRTSTSRSGGGVREGVRYVRSTTDLLIPLVMMAIIGTFALEFSVSLPLLATFSFHEGAELFSVMMTVLSIGGAIGVLFVANRRPTVRSLCWASLAIGITILAVAVAPTPAVALVLLVTVGVACFVAVAFTQTILQLTTAPEMRGRVMGLWMVAGAGSSAIGGLLIGWIGDHLGPRYGLMVGGVSAVVAAALGHLALGRARARAGAGSRGPAPAAAVTPS